ncbi:hypothetical protein DSCO28_50570 [Desulfosarcina ovata subsp. sediminis]|uniref:Peptidase M15A C-terminal domain-containing protein n=1 Tax=Desulfosarcina ovata subsp. sediminis TaxID=885957 RepID=A0A5K7ZWK1_9BACT|nr:hypothetical protein [Desulfosarcina ovata]BBO80185.1 hypothetical protein DSCO28_07510 [Desulfosarcina ovata subsp. sediminis]BBO84491.1 hypothetical protein DSCO28_50570 [Desulfosarcina ovata subsp. sediminis]
MTAEEINWDEIKYFSPRDFDDPNVPGSWRHMAADSILWLNDLRERTGWPIIPHNQYGVRGCVCVDPSGHSMNSRHYINYPGGCSAIDFHFACDASRREQAKAVMETRFTGIGVYYDWRWNGRLLPVGFHVDIRPRPLAQIWKRVRGEYLYYLR